MTATCWDTWEMFSYEITDDAFILVTFWMKQDLIEKQAFAYGRGGGRLLARASGSPWWQVLRQSEAYTFAKLQRWSHTELFTPCYVQKGNTESEKKTSSLVAHPV